VKAAHRAAASDILTVIEARALSTRTGHGGVQRWQPSAQRRQRSIPGNRRAPTFEIDGIGDDLVDLVETRATAIDAVTVDCSRPSRSRTAGTGSGGDPGY